MAKSRARKLADLIVGAGIDIDGNLTFDGGSTSADLTFADNDKANFGDASDLQIYHDGSNSWIKDTGTGSLLLTGSTGVFIRGANNENSIQALEDGAVNLYYDGNKKFETTSTGVKFSGTLTADDNQSILLGTGSDLRIKHDGTDSIIADEGGGDLIFKAYDDFYFKQVTDDANILRLNTGGDATFYGHVSLADDKQLKLGDSNELVIYHTASGNSIISEAGGGSLYLDGTNIYLRKSTASGETMGAFVADGAATLYYDNSAKLATFSGGVSVTGQLNATTMHLPDGSTGLQLGASNDTKFFHDGSNSKITHSGSGGFYIGADTLGLQTGAHNENYLTAAANGAVSLYYDNSAKLATATGGITVTGETNTTTLASGNSTMTGLVQIGNSSGGTLVFKRPSANYIFADQTGGYLVFGTNGRSTSIANSNFYLGADQSSTFVGQANFNDSISSDGPIVINGSGSEDRYLKFALDGRGSAFTGENAAFIFCGQGGSGDFLAGGLYLQSRSATAGREIGFITGTTPAKRMVIDSSGNVGIGNTSPDQVLDVSGNIASNNSNVGRLYLGNTSASYYAGAIIAERSSSYAPTGYMSFQVPTHGVGSDYGLTEHMFIEVTAPDTKNATVGIATQGGKVGIATDSPASTLHIKTSVDNSVAQGLIIERSANSDRGYINYNGGGFQFRSTVGDPIVFGETDAEHVRILPDGNVGIGKTNPLQKLNVHGKISSNIATADHYYGAWLDGNSTSGQDSLLGLGTWHNNAGYVKFFQSSAPDRLAIYTANTSDHVTLQESGGNVGIGTTSPSTKLHVNYGVNASVANLAEVDNYSPVRFGSFRADNDDNLYFMSVGGGKVGIQSRDSSASGVARILSLNPYGGNVGIGTASPERGLHVVGGIHLPNNNIISWDQANGTLRNAMYVDSGDDMIIGDTNFDDIYFSTGQKTKTVVIKQTTGRVGVGTTAPSSLVHASLGNQALGFDSGIWVSANPSDYTTGRGAGITMQNADVYTGGIYGIRELNSWQGALAFYTHTGTSGNTFGTTFTEKMRITNEGKVGIGTTSPGFKLEIADDTNGAVDLLRLRNSDGTYSQSFDFSLDTGKNLSITGASGNGGIILKPGSYGTEIRRDAGGALGAKLTLRNYSNTAGSYVRLQLAPTQAGVDDRNVTIQGENIDGNNNMAMVFKTSAGASPAEAMRIDQNGNLLVGKQSANFTVDGHEIRKTSYAGFTRDGGLPLLVNRRTSSGDMIEFYKDSTSIGTIGSIGGANLFINSKGSGGYGRLQANGTDIGVWWSNGFYPGTDASYDLGVNTGSGRWRNLFLSGAFYSNNGYITSLLGINDTNTYINFAGSDQTRFYQGGTERARFDGEGLRLATGSAIIRDYRTLYNGSAAANTVQYIKLYDRNTTTAGSENLHFYMRGFNHSEYSVEVKIFIPTYSGFTTSYGTMDAGQGIEVEIICGGLSSQGNVFQEIIEVANLSSTTDNTEIWLKTQVPHATTGISISEAADSTDTLIPTGNGSGWTTTAPSNQHRVFPIKIGKTINGIHTTRDSKLGIGTTAPLNPLHVKKSGGTHLMALETSYSTDRTGRGQLSWRDSSNITGGIWTEYDGSQVSMRFGNLYNSGYNTNTSMIIRGNGNVGIGTGSPANPLHIVDSRNYAHSTTADSSTNMAGLRVTNSNNNSNWAGIWFATGSAIGSHWSGIAGARTNHASTWGTHLSFFTHEDATQNITQATERMRIDSSGNVGIGTSSPISNSNRTTLALQGVWGGQMDIMVGSTVHAQFGTDNFGSGQSCRIQSQDGIVFKAGGTTERMRIDSSGHVIAPNGVTLGTAIGTYNADNTLDDYEEGTWTGRLASSSSGGTYYDSGGATGYYIKVGRLVHIQIHYTSTVSGSGGAIYLQGLPYAAQHYNSMTHWFFSGFSNLTAGYVPIKNQ